MRSLFAEYLGSALTVCVAALVAAVISRVVVLPHVSVLMLVAVLFSALRWGLGPSLFAAACSVAVSSYFFMPPIYSFYVSAPQDVIDLIVFFVAAVVTSRLAWRAKLHAAEAARRETTMRQLSSFSRSLAGLLDPDGLLHATALHCTLVLQRRAVLLIPKGATLLQFAPETGSEPLSSAAMDDAKRLWAEWKTAVAATATSSRNGWDFRAVLGQQGAVGLLALEIAVVPLTQDDKHLIESILPQISRIVERGVSVMPQSRIAPRPNDS